MSQTDTPILTLRQIRDRVDAETAMRIADCDDPHILIKLTEACNGDPDQLTSEIARGVVFVAETDVNRAGIESAYRDRYGV